MSFTESALRQALHQFWAMPSSRPDIVVVNGVSAAVIHAEVVRGEWLARGVNWRRAKREYRKAYEARLKRLRNQN